MALRNDLIDVSLTDECNKQIHRAFVTRKLGDVKKAFDSIIKADTFSTESIIHYLQTTVCIERNEYDFYYLVGNAARQDNELANSYIKLLRSLLKEASNPEDIYHFIWTKRSPESSYSYRLFSHIDPKIIKPEQTANVKEYLLLLKDLNDANLSKNYLYAQFTPKGKQSWAFHEFIQETNNPELIYHTVNTGILISGFYDYFRAMALDVFNYIQTLPEADNTKIIDAITQKESPLHKYFKRSGVLNEVLRKLKRESDDENESFRLFKSATRHRHEQYRKLNSDLTPTTSELKSFSNSVSR